MHVQIYSPCFSYKTCSVFQQPVPGMLCMLFCAFQYFLNLITTMQSSRDSCSRSWQCWSSSRVELVVPHGQVYFESEESLEASFMLQEHALAIFHHHADQLPVQAFCLISEHIRSSIVCHQGSYWLEHFERCIYTERTCSCIHFAI